MVKEVVQDFQTSVLQVKPSQKGEIHQEGATVLPLHLETLI